MAVAVVQSVTNSANPFVTDGIADLSFPGNTTIGNLILVGFHIEASSRTVSSASGGGAALSQITQGGVDATAEIAATREIWVWGGVATSATTAVSVTLSSAFTGNSAVWAIELSGQHGTFATAIEDVAVGITNPGASGVHSSGNVTTASAGSALVGFIGGSSGTYNQDVDYTTLTNAQTANGNAGYDLVDAVTADYGPDTPGVEDTVQVVIAVAPSGGGGGGSTPRRLLTLGVG